MDTSSSWSDVQDRLERLTMKLRYHLQQATPDAREEAKAVMDRFAGSVDGAISGIRAASHDPAVREDLREATSSLAQAINDTLTSVGDEIRKAFSSGDDGQGGPAGPGGPSGQKDTPDESAG